MFRFARNSLLLCLITLGSVRAQVLAGSWSDKAFVRARQEKCSVLLELEAV